MKRAAITIALALLALYVLVYRLLPPYGTEGFWPRVLLAVMVTMIGIGLFELVWRTRKGSQPEHPKQ